MERFLLLLFFSISTVTNAANLKGFVHDISNDEPLVGATIYLKNTTFGASVGLDGSYLIKGIPAGTYMVTVSMLGYASVEREVSVTDKDESLNFSLTENTNQLKEIIIKGIADDQSEINAKRAEQKADNILNIIRNISLNA